MFTINKIFLQFNFYTTYLWIVMIYCNPTFGYALVMQKIATKSSQSSHMNKKYVGRAHTSFATTDPTPPASNEFPMKEKIAFLK